jgi:hypothetical protein
MTVNIGLVTSDAVLLGCDSIASTTGYFLDPIEMDWETGPGGEFTKDANGKFTLKFTHADYKSIVTNSWGGVTKLFQIHPNPTPVVAVTAGLAKLKGRPIASWGGEFFTKCEKRGQKLVNVEKICKAFLEFIRAKYDEHYKEHSIPEQFREGPEFLIAGYGRDDDLPTLFRVNIKDNKMEKEFGAGPK